MTDTTPEEKTKDKIDRLLGMSNPEHSRRLWMHWIGKAGAYIHHRSDHGTYACADHPVCASVGRYLDQETISLQKLTHNTSLGLQPQGFRAHPKPRAWGGIPCQGLTCDRRGTLGVSLGGDRSRRGIPERGQLNNMLCLRHSSPGFKIRSRFASTKAVHYRVRHRRSHPIEIARARHICVAIQCQVLEKGK